MAPQLSRRSGQDITIKIVVRRRRLRLGAETAGTDRKERRKMAVLTKTAPHHRAIAPSRLRVVLMCDVVDGAQQRFLDAYEQLRHQVAAVPGHITDQLCQSI